MDRPVSDIVVRDRHRKQLGDLTELAESMHQHGLLHPIVITSDNYLIAGQRRLEAAKLLGWERVPVNVVDLDGPVHAEADENMIRLDFAPSERVAIAKAIERNIILTGKVPNPKNPNFPTTSIRLNRPREDVRRILAGEQEASHGFEPIEILGQGLSETVAADRR